MHFGRSKAGIIAKFSIAYSAKKLTIGCWVLKMLGYNFLMFVPFGFLLPPVSEKINNRSIWKVAVIVPIVVEVIQPVVGRSFDVDDLILNFAGIIVGYCVAIGTKSLKRKAARTHESINQQNK